MIVYHCVLPAKKTSQDHYETHYVLIETQHVIPDNRLRRMVIDKLPKEYVEFGHLTYRPELKGENHE